MLAEGTISLSWCFQLGWFILVRGLLCLVKTTALDLKGEKLVPTSDQ